MRDNPASTFENDVGGRDRTLADQAYERILSMIVDGTIPVGGKLPTEHKLSQQFQMSRPVLRQALKQLREDEVIVSRQGSGSYVMRRPDGAVLDFAPIGSIADIQRTFEFRAAVEGEAAFLAAKRRSDADITRMRDALQELDRCIAAGELGVDADEAFHAVICGASDNQYFVTARTSMTQNITTGMNLTRSLSLTKTHDRLALVQAEHYAIFEALRNQDQNAARTAMRAHIENARKRIFDGTL
ncbi:DNA-binding transcriptional regulator, FadR family [Monaibacterium marinum]|uniref:DNA-binding transcriptional regulator, FadR family n=1 Tax=Pontivivens marinum TaxID=1690039 RepID=A0A2C9CRU0_9RHOB|nr:FadR/GntR family transcriptional regulator [Monaibacterium marinum]SOH93928.1 DNA-binding transcriptional regulator, FadR family [Monaibacterium marinum]